MTEPFTWVAELPKLIKSSFTYSNLSVSLSYTFPEYYYYSKTSTFHCLVVDICTCDAYFLLAKLDHYCQSSTRLLLLRLKPKNKSPDWLNSHPSTLRRNKETKYCVVRIAIDTSPPNSVSYLTWTHPTTNRPKSASIVSWIHLLNLVWERNRAHLFVVVHLKQTAEAKQWPLDVSIL